MSRRGPRPVNLRLRRILVMLPWLMERGTVSTSEMAAHFGLSVDELIADLTLASLCGISEDPNDLIDLWVDEDEVHFGLPKYFERPLRLTLPEAFALVVSAKAARSLPGADSTAALDNAIGKIAGVIGENSLAGLDVEIDAPEAVAGLTKASTDGSILSIDYWSPTTGESTTRRVTALEVFADGPHWYLRSFDHGATAERTFRIDRIESWVATGESERRPVSPRRPWFTDSPDATSVMLAVDPSWTWVLEQYPLVSTATRADGWVEVRLVVTSERWLRRLLLRLGTHARVLEPSEWIGLAADSAVLVRDRYRRT
ncbi:MAG: putative proteasome accessory factor [Actinomycetota bacterium]|jgi:proteasome accessory factor C